jgi:glycosyltransferase involved in cell wall biosynthesis
MKKPRLAFLITNMKGGGAEKVTLNLANGFCLRGYHVDLILFQTEGVFLNGLLPSIRIISLNVQSLRHGLLPLIRYIRKAKPKFLFANMWPISIIAMIAKLFSGMNLRVLIVEHAIISTSEIFESRTTEYLARITIRLIYPLASNIIAVSNGVANDLAFFGHLDLNKIRIINNPIVDSKPFPAFEGVLPPTSWWNGSHLRIIAAGSLKWIKGFDVLIKAMAELILRLDVKLLILGEGPERSNLEMQINALGLQEYVFLPGFADTPDVYFKHANLFVLSSRYEGFGNVLVESLAVGTPVVSTDCPSGPREILLNGYYGQLVPVDEPSALVFAIVEALNSSHDTEQLILRAKDFSIDNSLDEYESNFF